MASEVNVDLLVVGSYSDDKTKQAIKLFCFSASTGELSTVPCTRASNEGRGLPLEHPSFVHILQHDVNPGSLSPTASFSALVASEADDREGEVGLVAFQVVNSGEQWHFECKEVARAPSAGWTPCHVDVEAHSGIVAVSNYAAHDGGATISFFRRELGPDSSTTQLQSLGHVPLKHRSTGSGLDAQKNSHGHACLFLNERYAVCTDLGSDIIGLVRLAEPPVLVSETVLPSGTGPRHMVLSPSEEYLYVAGEWSIDVSVLKLDLHSEPPTLTLLSAVPVRLPSSEPLPPSQVAAIKRFGHHVYVSNRGDNAISVFDVDESDESRLTLKQVVSCGGNWPRDLVVHPSGKYILVANQLSSTINLLDRDLTTGLLTLSDKTASSARPSCLVFVKQGH